MRSYLTWRINQIANPLGYNVSLNPLSIQRAYRYSPPKGPARHLKAEHFTPTRLSGTDEEQATGELYSIWRGIPGGHKWHHYFATYEAAVRRLGDRPLRMLEIGVNRGGSAKMWNQFLPTGSLFVGIDINPECGGFEDAANSLFIRIGDQSDPAFIENVINEFGPFDLILDDGSHICSHMVASFNHLFLNGLNNPGVYLVEDVQTNFWQEFRDQKYSFLDFSKDLTDLMHSHYFDHPGEPFFRKGHDQHLSSALVPRIAAEIDEIQFRDSIIVIHKVKKNRLPISEYL